MKHQSSGQNEDDVMKAAHEIFFNDYQAKFTMEHCWRELRHDQKWKSVFKSRDGAKEKRKEAEEVIHGDEVRPPGVKASKAAKRKRHRNEAAYDRLQSILDLKQNISKQKLLDRLLSKKETLTESEVAMSRVAMSVAGSLVAMSGSRVAMSVAGTLNDINVLDRSPVFDDILQGRAPKVKFKVNNHTYRMTYYLTDGIYPNWATFIQSIPLPQSLKAQKFAEKQESVRKDVERAFGVLQSRFAIVKNPALKWDKEKIGKIMRTCVILHNMIVEDERHGYTLADTSEFESGESSRNAKVKTRESVNVDILNIHNQIRDPGVHERLKVDLVENVWEKFGNRDE
uniref:No apical meristem-associated C-terminal domain-containing protein n=1 Tax=Brassica oleracea var. oleracea TaxID=109376 RepID=A0A0D3CUF5_BRAOL